MKTKPNRDSRKATSSALPRTTLRSLLDDLTGRSKLKKQIASLKRQVKTLQDDVNVLLEFTKEKNATINQLNASLELEKRLRQKGIVGTPFARN